MKQQLESKPSVGTHLMIIKMYMKMDDLEKAKTWMNDLLTQIPDCQLHNTIVLQYTRFLMKFDLFDGKNHIK